MSARDGSPMFSLSLKEQKVSSIPFSRPCPLCLCRLSCSLSRSLSSWPLSSLWSTCFTQPSHFRSLPLSSFQNLPKTLRLSLYLPLYLLSMEFWGVEVKAGAPLKVTPELNKVLHLSQAVLGEIKKDKGDESIVINVKVGNQKLVLGHLSLENLKQLQFDLVFEKEFELSHNWKNGSVYFSGYQSTFGDDSDEFDDSDLGDSEEEEEELIPANAVQNGKVKGEQAKQAPAKVNAAKPAPEKPKVKVVEPSKDEDSDDDDDESDDDEDGSEDDSDEDMPGADSDEVDDDESDEEDEETPKKPQPQPQSGKKRPNESASKTPVSAKKAKAVTPQKTGGKKEAHVATPHPSKKAGKTPASADKSKPQTPKSVGQVSCKTCSKSFNSETALSSHTKAKHT